MGGTKKKTLSSSDKTAAAGPAGEVKTKEDAANKKGTKPQYQKQQQKLSVVVEESQGMKALQGMRAISTQGLARNTGVKISVANAFIKSLESKGVVKRV